MTGMDDLATWLRAQLDEDERVARGAGPGGPGWAPDSVLSSDDELAHITRWDPARVLAEVNAKRRVLDVVLAYEAKIDGEWGCCHSAGEIAAGQCQEINPNDIHAVRLLALPYADRSGYLEAWRP